jgi:hypothetical protein
VDIRYKLQLAGNLGSSRFFSLIWRRCGELEILNCNGVMELEACGVILGGGGGLINGFSYSRIRGGINSAGNSFVWCCEIKAMVLALDF